ncbi:uncharacterized protein EURHEDRAFT_451481 [Aspergillus ruber CBS 135680]|uniref:MIT domain-containing protein n=1 Tax=Aspergillus ruber (strain CBS 135680) TaxID=1388766 RepID=A0A017SK36_ASPRC|nr:uncharacterized protein EURHEDRAFT_451481 [Aspergillus ruber CBS 135680]EYE97307.1 hypothetical protein EURHEDRAFT_451481 [Aspergillus ruber CBS 135680]
MAANSPSTEENLSPFVDTETYKGKHQRGQSQKTMLSKALQKANTAVLLDNAANFEGAMDAYNDACYLLQLVMLRSNGGEDEKLKLQEIRDTYMIRVTELERMDFSFRESGGKALPERPLSQESDNDLFHPREEDYDETLSGNSISPRQHPSELYSDNEISEERRTLVSGLIPPRRQSLLPSALNDSLEFRGQYNRPQSQSSWQQSRDGNWEGKHYAADNDLSFTLSPTQNLSMASDIENNQAYLSHYSELPLPGTEIKDTNESTSWLDTIDESGASSPSSLRSKRSSAYLRQRTSRLLSHGTETEFDAALDAAVEAAYDEGLEPAIDIDDGSAADDIVVNARRNVELAKQKVREAEREAEVAMTRGREMHRIQEHAMLDQHENFDREYLDEEAEEEERLLEEMTMGYVMDDFEFDIQSKSALPRQSDSSNFSGRTWESSTASNNTTAGAALSTLAEDRVLTSAAAKRQSNTLPLAQPAPATLSTTPDLSSGASVRERRLSGRDSKELKIDTSARLRDDSDVSTLGLPTSQLTSRPLPLPKDEPQTNLPNNVNQNLDPASALRLDMNSDDRNASIGSLTEGTPTSIGLSKAITQEDEEDTSTGLSTILSPARAIGKVPSAPDNLGKQNASSKAFRVRNASVPAPDLTADSPGTPSSSMFPTLDLQKGMATGTIPILPTPTGANFTPNGLPSDGLYLFDSHIHSPTRPGFPNTMAANHPAPLEPCPESFLLRPFWLMRCIYQTIAHPSGGYLSTKLFIPRDVWRVKNAKMKALEEKVSSCDLLTAALLKLSQVDMYDADAVLEEMQSFESVLDQVQTALSKKLGSEVGVQGAMPLFKMTPASDDAMGTTDTLPSKASNGPSTKSYLTSWRKLRSKNSGFGSAAPPNSKETGKDNPTINTLPMTPMPSTQTIKRNVTQLQFNGPNANYMGALARLCDAAQAIDQIAQQVEDPGLKHSSPTLVGLELSTRHAAEFFGFYICRFVLNDVGLMLDKFIKRGSEWVLT